MRERGGNEEVPIARHRCVGELNLLIKEVNFLDKITSLLLGRDNIFFEINIISSQTRKITAIKRAVVRETGVCRNHGGSPDTPRTMVLRGALN